MTTVKDEIDVLLRLIHASKDKLEACNRIPPLGTGRGILDELGIPLAFKLSEDNPDITLYTNPDLEYTSWLHFSQVNLCYVMQEILEWY